MTLREALKRLTERFSDDTDIDAPEFEAKNLLLSVMALTPERYLLERENAIPEEAKEKLDDLAARRLSGEPLQYLVGEWDFCGLPMYCGKGCLIPRPETEAIVELAVKLLPEGGRFIDLCTGSGCIAAALLSLRPDASGIALDISEDALMYAKRNADRHGVAERLESVKSDLAEYIPRCGESFDLILSNPPYVKTKDVDAFGKELRHEPRIAFDGGEDGLDLYRVIVERYAGLLKSTGAFIFEAGYDTTEAVADIARAKGLDAEVINDIHDLPRICMAKYPLA